ncbi:hypothetical protein IX321_001679 [Bacteroides pyogenes]|nr:hypothetical protein [Bacteroides pyogenes]MBR8717673.1 hypothetical protein [Bacteroides pyogenes]MBR8747174.1 hypothetical protein [Bacteroides pyogenes]MBR8757518.1 hypothetical protein [Bacteroides pyogenes]MBR8780744.1 hypothetical protein [Bacteroides pyogenes]
MKIEFSIRKLFPFGMAFLLSSFHFYKKREKSPFDYGVYVGKILFRRVLFIAMR